MPPKNITNVKIKILGSAENRTQGCWARSKYATSVLCPIIELYSYLAEDRDVVDAVVVGQRLDESVAEAGLAGADGSLLLLASGQPDDGDGQESGGSGTGRGVAAAKSQTWNRDKVSLEQPSGQDY